MSIEQKPDIPMIGLSAVILATISIVYIVDDHCGKFPEKSFINFID